MPRDDSWDKYRLYPRAMCAFRVSACGICAGRTFLASQRSSLNPWVLGSSPRRPTGSDLALCDPQGACRLPGMGRGWPRYGRTILGAHALRRPLPCDDLGLDGSGRLAVDSCSWLADIAFVARTRDLPGWVSEAEPARHHGACLPPQGAPSGAAAPLGARNHAARRDGPPRRSWRL
jgi:hypothetical protein